LPIDCPVKPDIYQTGGLALDPIEAIGDNPRRSVMILLVIHLKLW